MKTRFDTLDVAAAVKDFQSVVGLRVHKVYDVNSKTYLIRLKEKDNKQVILLESGIRIHLTQREWPTNQMPSGFSMKLRKHISNARMISCKQLGVDRVVVMSFESGKEKCHVIVELYDRGNVMLVDDDYRILNILRPRTDKDHDVKLRVGEVYPTEYARQEKIPDAEAVVAALKNAKPGTPMRRVLSPLTCYGSSCLEKFLIQGGFSVDTKVEQIPTDEVTVNKLIDIFKTCSEFFEKEFSTAPSVGYVTFTETKSMDGTVTQLYQEFSPMGEETAKCKQTTSFSEAVDDFFASQRTQKTEQASLAKERDALKKLQNVRDDQAQRVRALEDAEILNEQKAECILLNKEVVEKALIALRTLLANQSDWEIIKGQIKTAADMGDEVASTIVGLALDKNQFTMRLSANGKFGEYDEDSDEETEPEKKHDVVIDISLNPFQNSRRYFVNKKAAVVKKEKTVQASTKAIKNAELKAKAVLDQNKVEKAITKLRKQMWMEKFKWFISSEGYTVVGGRDAHQNEYIVKKYLRPGNIYIHAEAHGAASVVVWNKPGGGEIPPKTLQEAAQFAVCNSSCWEAGTVAKAWYVYHNQVSRTAPTGTYLASGSFMIRGKKNMIPDTQLVMGFGVLFKISDDSIAIRKAAAAQKATDEQKDTVEAEEEKKTIESEEVEIPKEEEKEMEEKSDEDEFPDVQVAVSALKIADESVILELGPKKGGGKKQEKPSEKKQTEEYLETKRKEEEAAKKAKQGPSARQKRKAKLMNKKYGDQDEDERIARMKLVGNPMNIKEKVEEKEEETIVENPVEEKKEKEEKKDGEENKTEARPLRAPRKVVDEGEEGEGDDETGDGGGEVLEGLLVSPSPEDHILYAVPVVAPYSAMNAYKFKVKLTPGTGKRSKTIKTCYDLFVANCGRADEKNAIRALIGDDTAVHNFPGKVHMSAPLLQQLKKKKK